MSPTTQFIIGFVIGVVLMFPVGWMLGVWILKHIMRDPWDE